MRAGDGPRATLVDPRGCGGRDGAAAVGAAPGHRRRPARSLRPPTFGDIAAGRRAGDGRPGFAPRDCRCGFATRPPRGNPGRRWGWSRQEPDRRGLRLHRPLLERARPTAVFGTLNAPGLSAPQQISTFGSAGEHDARRYDRRHRSDGLPRDGQCRDRRTYPPKRSDRDRRSAWRRSRGVSVHATSKSSTTPTPDGWFYSALRCNGTTSSNRCTWVGR